MGRRGGASGCRIGVEKDRTGAVASRAEGNVIEGGRDRRLAEKVPAACPKVADVVRNDPPRAIARERFHFFPRQQFSPTGSRVSSSATRIAPLPRRQPHDVPTRLVVPSAASLRACTPDGPPAVRFFVEAVGRHFCRAGPERRTHVFQAGGAHGVCVLDLSPPSGSILRRLVALATEGGNNSSTISVISRIGILRSV